jgi:hypothetical protein
MIEKWKLREFYFRQNALPYAEFGRVVEGKFVLVLK